MRVRELRDALALLPPEANVEVCVREDADYSVDLEVTGVSEVLMPTGAEEAYSWVTLSTGGLVCDHA